MSTQHSIGESFAYFAWHRLKYPNCPPESHPRPWRHIQWLWLQSIGGECISLVAVDAALSDEDKSHG